MKGLALLLLLPGILLLASCKDDGDSLEPDTNVSITGYWTVGQGDFDKDGKITGVIVHDDGTVSEWQYSLADTGDPFQLGYKTGTWRINGGNYELTFSNGKGGYYIAKVDGNNEKEMRLYFNGKVSVVPLYKTENLPGNGNKMVETMDKMKYSDFQISDLTGYWEKKDNTVYATTDMGIYIDGEGNVSRISTAFGRKTIDYHNSSVTLNSYVTSFDYWGQTYSVYAVGGDVMLATADGQTIDEFDRSAAPQIVADADAFINEPVDDRLLGTWESVHYLYTIGNDTITNVDITPSDTWAMQMYKKYVFGSNHKVAYYNNYYGRTSYANFYFRYDDSSHTLITSTDINGVLLENYTNRNESTVNFTSPTEMTLTTAGESTTVIYTYRKQ